MKDGAGRDICVVYFYSYWLKIQEKKCTDKKVTDTLLFVSYDKKINTKFERLDRKSVV